MIEEFFKNGLPKGVVVEKRGGRLFIKADSAKVLREAALVLDRASVRFSEDGLILEVSGATDLVDKNHSAVVSRKVSEWKEFKKGKSTGAFRAASEEREDRGFGLRLAAKMCSDGFRLASEEILSRAEKLRTACQKSPIRKVTSILNDLEAGRKISSREATNLLEDIDKREGTIVDTKVAIEGAMEVIGRALTEGASLENLRSSPEKYYTEWKDRFDRKDQQLVGNSWSSLWLEALTKVVSSRVGSWRSLRPSKIARELSEGSVEFEVADPFEFDTEMNTAGRDNRIQAAVAGILEETAGNVVPAEISKNFTAEFLQRYYPDLSTGEVWPCILRVSRRASTKLPRTTSVASVSKREASNTLSAIDQQLQGFQSLSHEETPEVNW